MKNLLSADVWKKKKVLKRNFFCLALAQPRRKKNKKCLKKAMDIKEVYMEKKNNSEKTKLHSHLLLMTPTIFNFFS